MKNGLQFSTQISIRDRGDFLIERVCHGVVVDKYTTQNLKVWRRSAPWSGWIYTAANTPLGSTLAWENLSDDMMCELEPQYVEDKVFPKYDLRPASPSMRAAHKIACQSDMYEGEAFGIRVRKIAALIDNEWRELPIYKTYCRAAGLEA